MSKSLATSRSMKSGTSLLIAAPSPPIRIFPPSLPVWILMPPPSPSALIEISVPSPAFFSSHPQAARSIIGEIGRAHVCTPVPDDHLVCRLLLEKKKTKPHTAVQRPHS